ncbi:MAG: hypothetical protein AB7H66_01055 [Hyphomonadaceae bacterium]
MIRVWFEGKEYWGPTPKLSFVDIQVGSNDEANKIIAEAAAKGVLRTKSEWVPFHRVRQIERA